MTHCGCSNYSVRSRTPQTSAISKCPAPDTSSTVVKVNPITVYKPKSSNASNDSSQRHSSKNASKMFLLDLKTWNPDQNRLHLSAPSNRVMSALMIDIASRSQSSPLLQGLGSRDLNRGCMISCAFRDASAQSWYLAHRVRSPLLDPRSRIPSRHNFRERFY